MTCSLMTYSLEGSVSFRVEEFCRISLSLIRALALLQDKELQDEDDNLFLYLDAPLQRVFGGEQARPLLFLM